MRRINDREVELTGEEQLVQFMFHQMLDRGYGIAVAIEELRQDVANNCPRVRMDGEFWAWLAN